MLVMSNYIKLTVAFLVLASTVSCHDVLVFIQPSSNDMIHPLRHLSKQISTRLQYAEPSISQEIENLMSKHDPILLFASRFLPRQTAYDASALYAWCRRLDEITDTNDVDLSTKQDQLAQWEERFIKLYNGNAMDAMDNALYQCIQRHSDALTTEPFLDMISGMKSDTIPNRTIANMEELEQYAYQVAGTVGIMLLPLLKADLEVARSPAIALGKAIQMINILRDASPDATLGRIYLPQDLLHSKRVSNADIFTLTSSTGYCEVVKDVADRANALLLEAEIGKYTLPGIGPLFVQIIVELYRGYLTRLHEMEYDNLNIRGERVKISALQKLRASIRALIKL
jgi:phytoene synthase